MKNQALLQLGYKKIENITSHISLIINTSLPGCRLLYSDGVTLWLDTDLNEEEISNIINDIKQLIKKEEEIRGIYEYSNKL